MLAELGVQDHRQQARPGAAAGDDVERRRRLGDRLARPAGELLPHRLDHLPLPRDHLQRLGDRPRRAWRACRRSTGRPSAPGSPRARAADAPATARAPAFVAGERATVVLAGRCRGGLVLGRARLQLPRVAAPAGRAACGRARRSARTARASAWRSAASDARPSPRRRRRAPRPRCRAARSAASAAFSASMSSGGRRARSSRPD